MDKPTNSVWEDVQHGSRRFWRLLVRFWRQELWPKIWYVLVHIAEALVDVIPESLRLVTTAMNLLGPMINIYIMSVALIIVAYVIFFGLDLTYDTVKGLSDIINALSQAIGKAANAGAGLINKAASLVGAHSHLHVHIPSFDACSLIHGLCDVLKLHHYCRPYMSAWAEFGLFWKIVLSRHTCPFWRWTVFTKHDWISLYSTILPPLIGFTSWDPEPWPGNNCASSKFSTACFWILMGYFLRALLYLGIITVLIANYRRTESNLIKIPIAIAYWTVVALFELFRDCFTWAKIAVSREERKHLPKQLPAIDRVFVRHIRSRALRRSAA